jgi:hypothetical protein
MSPAVIAQSDNSRLTVLLEHFAQIKDPRDVRRILHPFGEILLLVVCATIANCDDYDHIAAWGEAHLDFLCRYAPFEHGVPGGRWLTILMNRINPALFQGAFTGLPPGSGAFAKEPPNSRRRLWQTNAAGGGSRRSSRRRRSSACWMQPNSG